MPDNHGLNRNDYFELRTKRLAVVYKILYVFVAIWMAVIISMPGSLNHSTLPIFAFLLSATTMCILNMLSYILLELQCMKVTGPLEDSLVSQSEEKYSHIWSSFGIIVVLNLMLMLISYLFINERNIEQTKGLCFFIAFFVSILSATKHILCCFTRKTWLKIWNIIDIVFLFISPMCAYAVALFLLGVIL